MFRNGYELNVTYKGDPARNFMGGLKVDNAFTENLDVRFTIDAEKAYGLDGVTFYIYGLGNHGTHANKPSTLIGDLQGTDNIEATADDFKLYEVWFQKLFYDSRLSILVGLHDLNSEFYVTESSTTLINPSFGVSRDLSQTGKNGPSIFPYTAPAFRVRTEPSDTFYFQTGMYVAQAGDPNHPTGFRANFSSSDGYLLIIEGGTTSGKEDLPFKVGIGGWTYTKSFTTLDETSEQNSSGMYGLFDYSVAEDLSFFVRYGVANTHVSKVGSSVGVGLLLKKPVNSRPDDEFSLGLSRVTIGEEYHNLQEAKGIRTHEAEMTLEATYKAKITNGFHIQPDLQYIKDPGADESMDDALIGFVRFQLDL